jgi:hypothetical protein
VFVSLPCRPDEVGVTEVLRLRRGPPHPRLDGILDHLEIVAEANIVFLGELEQLLLVFLLLSLLE